MAADARVFYVYGIVRDGFDVSRAPAGLDETPVSLTTHGRIAALTSPLPARDYGSVAVERSSGEVSWLSPRALAHDRVLTWAQEHGGVIPLPMFSLWGSEAALHRSLAEQESRLLGVFDRVAGADEFGLRVHRRDAVMLQTVHELDSGMAELRAQADAAPPGQRYLIESKIADQGKAVLRTASQRLARQIYDELRAIARDARARPLTPEAGGTRAVEATLVLNGAFLVDRRRLDEFRAAVGAHVEKHERRGLSFDFTGPWPPYNFVADAGGTALVGERGEAART